MTIDLCYNFAFVEQSGTIKEQCFRWVNPIGEHCSFFVGKFSWQERYSVP